MDRAPIPFPHAGEGTSLDPLERDLLEVEAAIELVLQGLATRVRLTNLSRPDAAAGHAVAATGGLALRVTLEGSAGEPRTLTIETAGPRPAEA